MKVLIVSPDAARSERLQRALAGESSVSSIAFAASPLSASPAPMMNGRVDLLVLDGAERPLDELDALERLPAGRGRVPTILLLGQDSSEVLLRALRIGVREVVPVASIEQDFAPAFRRVQQVSPDRAERRGTLLSFMACKGGSGSTFLSTNLGYALAARPDTRVLLIDLNLQFGDAHLMVSDRKPTMSVADLTREIERVDVALLKGSLVEVGPNYGLLPSPEDPAMARDVKPAQLDRLLELARAEFDFVILDLGRSLDPVTIRALDQSDFVMPVMQLTVPHVREARRFLQVLRSLDCPPAKIRLLVNRMQKEREVSVDDVVRVLAREVFATVPNHFGAVAASVNQGVPVMKLARSSPVSKSLESLAQAFCEQPATRSSWFKRVLGQ